MAKKIINLFRNLLAVPWLAAVTFAFFYVAETAFREPIEARIFAIVLGIFTAVLTLHTFLWILRIKLLPLPEREETLLEAFGWLVVTILMYGIVFYVVFGRH